ncbi:MAG: hypothetical protein RBR40_05145 [Tenuifilaceae bacterium]|nr:hypothetical protein [Tenuifilaceae bacterium]
MKYTILAAILSIILFTECSNPDDHLIGTWDMDFSYVNGVREKENVPFSLIICNDGVFRQVAYCPDFKEDVKGTWDFNTKTNELVLTYSHTLTVVRWQIVVINKNLLRIRLTMPGFTVERDFAKRLE